MFKGGPGYASTLCHSLKSKEQKKTNYGTKHKNAYIYIYIYIYYTHMYVCMFAWTYQMKLKKVEKVRCYNF